MLTFQRVLSLSLLRNLRATTVEISMLSSYVSPKKQKMRERNLRYNMKMAAQNQPQEGLPSFAELLRKLYRVSHPDLIRSSHPEEAAVNDSSMQVLNGILSAVKVYNEFPPRIKRKIPFYLRRTGSAELRLVDLSIATSGGDCKHHLTETFTEFFCVAGICDGPFVWDSEFFPMAPREEEEEEDSTNGVISV